MPAAILNRTQNRTLSEKVLYCRSLFQRIRGLLGTFKEEAYACWLIPCSSIHTFGMKYPIDLYFLNRRQQIVKIMRNVPPFRCSPIVWKAYSVIEFPAGADTESQVGDELLLEMKS